ncbi:hypothetical protein WKV44_02210 [Spirochaetia bacterium 38H-sp]|uniref:Uncharacterized protein n=1 Tax=Rarispira pelagica TaxID=3141764 RepID=A0ABU9U9M3_9SPIR
MQKNREIKKWSTYWANCLKDADTKEEDTPYDPFTAQIQNNTINISLRTSLRIPTHPAYKKDGYLI